MKIVGRRFWTWMSVWALTFFVKGDLTAGPQEKATGQVTDGTSNTKHKVPLLKTQSSLKTSGAGKWSPALKTQYSKISPADKTSPESKTGSSNTRVGGKTSPTLESERLKTTSGTPNLTSATHNKVAADASSKDAAKMSSKTHAHKFHK